MGPGCEGGGGQEEGPAEQGLGRPRYRVWCLIMNGHIALWGGLVVSGGQCGSRKSLFHLDQHIQAIHYSRV